MLIRIMSISSSNIRIITTLRDNPVSTSSHLLPAGNYNIFVPGGVVGDGFGYTGQSSHVRKPRYDSRTDNLTLACMPR